MQDNINQANQPSYSKIAADLSDIDQLLKAMEDQQQRTAPAKQAQNFVAPQTELEKQLATIWTKILRVEKVGIQDNFFELGGNSILATQVVSQTRKSFQKEILLQAIFDFPTIEALGKQIEAMQASEEVAAQSIPSLPRSDNELLPLSFSQQRLWFIDQLDPGSSAYNMFSAVRLQGQLNISAWEQSIDTIVRRHESLRTTFSAVDGQPFQIIHPYHPWTLPITDLSDLSNDQQEIAVQKLVQEEAQHPFDLSQGPLFQAQLLKLSEVEHIFLLSMHHIISDGWSFGIFARELALLYNAYIKNETPSLPDLPIQYGDFAVWQQEWLQGEVEQTQLAYWTEQLAGELQTLELPTDYSRPPIQTLRGARQVRVLSKHLSRSLHELCQKEDVTLFMVLLAAFKLMLYRYTLQEDIVVGSPIAGRNKTELEGIIGFFINSVVLRTNLSGDISFRELLGRVREVAVNAYTNQDVPFEMLLDVLKPERDISRTPLFQIFFNMLNLNQEAIELPGLTSEFISRPELKSKFDLTFYISEAEDQVRLDLVYNADLFSAARMDEMLGQFEYVLDQAVTHPYQKVDEFSLVTNQSKTYLPNPAQPLDATWHGAIHSALSCQAQRQPNHMAILDPAEQWHYQELEARSNQLAHHLIGCKLKPQDVVMIYGHRSASLVWAVVGTLKAGATYVILDPAYPTDRLLEYISQAQPRGWLEIEAAQAPPSEIVDLLDALSCNCRFKLPGRSVAERENLLAEYPTTAPAIEIKPDNIAYISFTSGSTGKPKAILGRHGPLTHFLPWQETRFKLSADDNFCMLSGLAHDPLQRDMFTALWVGGTICIPDPDQIHQPGWLAQWFQQEEISIAHLTPAMGQVITETIQEKIPSSQQNSSLRYAFFVGDVLTRRDVQRLCHLAPNLQVINFYGSTETQRAVTYFVVPGGAEKPENELDSISARPKEIIPLGQGMPDIQLLILNAQRQLAGVGEVGEIYMRSPHLARGYLGNDSQTREKFISTPFASDASYDRCYRTGDLGRYLPDGNAEFAGRADQQVKIRGFRVELGEIEAVLGQYPEVREAVVILRQDKDDYSYLAAYIVPTIPDEYPSANALRDFLQEKIPNYMVPSVFVPLEKLPLTPNGKLDRRALPVPDQAQHLSGLDFVATSNEVEEQLTVIWQDLLRVPSIGIHDDFFALGGHSLMAVRLFARVEQEFGVNLPLTSLFREATIRHLAQLINQQTGKVTWSSLVPIQTGDDTSKPPFYCVHGVTGDIYWFGELAQHMDPDQPFYGLQSRGIDGLQTPLTSIEAMAEHYVDEIQEFQPEGPYYLGGYSAGANITLEMGRLLHARGQEVALLAILDHMPAKSDYFKVTWGSKLFVNLLKNLPYRLQDFMFLRPHEMIARIRKKTRQFRKKVNWLSQTDPSHRLQFNAGDLIDNADHFPQHIQRVIEVNYNALKKYTPQCYDGQITLLRAKGGRLFCSNDPEMGWGVIALKGVDVKVIPGSHLRIFKEPHVRYLAQELQSCLDNVSQTTRVR